MGLQESLQGAADQAMEFVNDATARVNDTLANVGQRVNETVTEGANRVEDFVDNVTQRANDISSQIEERFGGGAELEGNKVTFKVENDVIDTITIESVKQLTDDEAQASMSACA